MRSRTQEVQLQRELKRLEELYHSQTVVAVEDQQMVEISHNFIIKCHSLTGTNVFFRSSLELLCFPMAL